MEILAIRRSAFGDILHLMPALSAVKRALPSSRIILLSRPPYRVLAGRAPFIDEVWTGIQRTVDLAVDCQGLMRSAWDAAISGAPVRAGYSWGSVREKPAPLFYNRRVRVEAAHIMDRHAELFSRVLGMGIRVDKGYRAGFAVERSPRTEAFLSSVPAPRVLIHPFSSQAGKHLQARVWKQALGPVEERGWSMVLSCGPGEEGALAPWREAFPGAVAAPVLPLEDLPALVSGCRLVIGPDTGVIHLADQLGLPVLSWFSLWPPERNGPYFSPNLVFFRRDPDAGEVAAWLEELPPLDGVEAP